MAKVYPSETSRLLNPHRVPTQRVVIGLNMLLMLLVIVMFTVWLPGVGAAAQFDSPQATQVLKNRGFETKGSTAKLAANWTLFQGDNDQRECNKVDRPGRPDVIVAHTGKCAFRFIGDAGRTTLLTQNVKPVVGEAGDTLYLSGFIQATNLVLTDGAAQLRLMVDYQGGGNETRIAHISAGSYEYTQINAPPLLLTKAVKKVRVQVRIIGGSGRFYADTLSLVHVPAAEATAAPTWTSSLTPTRENTATPLPTNTPTATDTEFPSNTPTATPTSTATPKTPTATNTALPTFTSTPSRTRSATPTPSRTFTATPTNTFTATPTATFTHTAEPTFTHTPVGGADYCEQFRFEIFDEYTYENESRIILYLRAIGMYSARIDGVYLNWKDDLPGHSPVLTTIMQDQSASTLWTGNDSSSPTDTAAEGTFNFASPDRIFTPYTYTATQMMSFIFSDVPVPLDEYVMISDLMGSYVRLTHPSGTGETCNIPLTYSQFPTSTPPVYPCGSSYVQYNGMLNNGQVSYQVWNFTGQPLRFTGFYAAWPGGDDAYWLRRVQVRYVQGGTQIQTVWESPGSGQDAVPNTLSSAEGSWLGDYTSSAGQGFEIVLDFDPLSGSLASYGVQDWHFDGTEFYFTCGS